MYFWYSAAEFQKCLCTCFVQEEKIQWIWSKFYRILINSFIFSNFVLFGLFSQLSLVFSSGFIFNFGMCLMTLLICWGIHTKEELFIGEVVGMHSYKLLLCHEPILVNIYLVIKWLSEMDYDKQLNFSKLNCSLVISILSLPCLNFLCVSWVANS